AAVAFAVAAVAAVAIVGGVLGVSLDDLQDLAIARERFDERAAELLTWIDPLLSLAMVALGVLVAVSWRDGRRSRSAVWLAIAWLAVSAGGLALLALVPQIPGHRTLLVGVPAPALGALAIVGGGRWIGGRLGERSRARSVTAIAAAGLVAVAIVAIALRPFEVRAARPAPALGPGADVVAGYLLAVDADRPVVVVMDPADGLELLTWKARLNAVRAAAPDAVFLDVALYVGDERELLEGRRTDRPGDARFQAISARTWPAVDAVLDRDPAVLVVRPWVRPEAWVRVAGASSLAAADLAVLRGPTPTGAVRPVRPVRLPVAEAAARIALVLLALGSIGGGWALAASRVSPAPADAIGLAPAAGVAVVTFAGLAAAIGGWDPGGVPALLGIAAVATIGWIVARRTAAAAG
ncbi:MAG TPA: hypothetical protein VE800_11115, partial [Actinomycetota bacterium]|nr:hypothetical protein [Actinomycetota bacterium]